MVSICWWTGLAEAMALFARRAAEQYGSLELWPLGLGVPQHAVDRLRQALVVDELDEGTCLKHPGRGGRVDPDQRAAAWRPAR